MAEVLADRVSAPYASYVNLVRKYPALRRPLR
jgi:hypothetical protein